MSVNKIHLRKLLMLMSAPDAKVISTLRSGIREDIRRARGLSSDGGDFHVPFWHDVRGHIDGSRDIAVSVLERIASNPRRERLYSAMQTGFLDWWNNKRRWTNEAATSHFLAVKGRLEFPEIDCVVKVENLLAMFIGGARNRIIYPYFAEVPPLDTNTARLGLWALTEAISEYPPNELRLLDVIRGDSFAIEDIVFKGNEREEFLAKYHALLKSHQKLELEYDLLGTRRIA